MTKKFIPCDDCPFSTFVFSEKDCKDYCGEGITDTFETFAPSSYNGDYSSSNPWNAPGMSVKDFI